MSQATWIWYPGDFERMLFQKCMARRYERDVMITPFWRMDGYYNNVKFSREFTLTKTDTIRILAEGNFNIFFEELGYIKDFCGTVTLPAGSYHMSVLVYNGSGLPCLYVEGRELVSDERFSVTCQDHVLYPAGRWNFSRGQLPNEYRLKTRAAQFASFERTKNGTLYDFGKEVTARLCFHGLKEGQKVEISYGESREEALDFCNSEQFDRFFAEGEAHTVPITKTFRYALVHTKGEADVSLEEELPPSENRSKFHTEDALLQQIWDTAIRTNELTNREFFLDGGKRDRWSWGGDALQSEWIGFYSTFDGEIVKRTIRALGGRSPVATHVNHIMDYTQYWLLSLYDYYNYMGDRAFVEEMLPLAEEYVRFCKGRTDEEGFLCYRPNDWVFIDWAEMDNGGVTSFEQILFAAGLRAMGGLLDAVGRDGEPYRRESRELFERTKRAFWRNGAFVHGKKDGVLSGKVTRYANVFAVLYGLADAEMQQQILQNVVLNDSVQKITTPYMRFYELIVLAKTGHAAVTVGELRTYWGGMLAAGATTFWEKFDPEEGEAERYAMYGRPYGKSLCHAWGATPVYLIAACLFGISPAEVGYASFRAEPLVEALPPCEITVPAGKGNITLRIKKGEVYVSSDLCCGTVVLPEGYTSSARITGTAGEKVCYRVEAGVPATFIKE